MANGCKRFVVRLSKCGLGIVRFMLTANIEQYFFYNGLVYLALGVIAFLTRSNIRDFLCNIPPQASLGGIGCANCTDKLLLCPKQDCWWMATNLTIQKSAKTPDMPLYTALQASVLDTDCQSSIQFATGPRTMLSAILDDRESTAGQEPTAACVTFHCEVLMNSVVRSHDAELSGLPSELCTDKFGVKLGAKAEVCPCSQEVSLLTLDESAAFADLCGPAGAELTSLTMFAQNIQKSKPPCYASSVLGYYEPLMVTDPRRAQASFQNKNCSWLTQSASSPFGAFQLKSEKDRAAALPGATAGAAAWRVPTLCRLDFCEIFKASLTQPACNWPVDQTLRSMTKADVDLVIKECPGFGFSLSGICSLIGTMPDACQGLAAAVTSTETTTTLPGGIIRRLEEATPESMSVAAGDAPGAAQPCVDGPGEAGHICKPDSADMLTALHTGLTGLPSRSVTPPPSSGLMEGVGYMPLNPARTTPDTVGGGSREAAEARRLQTVTAAPNQGGGDMDWTVSDYSSCTCLQQCTSGVRTRSVACPSGMRCKDPKPPSSEPCTCGHCTDCKVEPIIFAMSITYWFQGTSCIMLCFLYYSVSSMTEDDLSDMRCITKLAGCLCKAWPVVVRIGVYVTLVFILVIVVIVLPGTGFMETCTHSGSLVLLTICISSCFVLQLVAGIIMKRKAVPPWLYNSSKPGVATLLMTPIRAIGP